MNPAVDLAKFGISTERLQGTVTSHNLTGRRLLFLFGERHTIRAGIKVHLLNALALTDMGALSCVGVEGWKEPASPVPCELTSELFNRQKAQHGDDEAAILDGIMNDYRPHNYVFWKTLTLLRPALHIRSVEDPDLFRKVELVSVTTPQDRIADIAIFFRTTTLPFSQLPLFPQTDEQRQTIIECKSTTQGMEEFAENELNYQRDAAFFTNMCRTWDEAGRDKAAILNAGVSHQYRIARLLRTNPVYQEEFSYVLIEQP